MNEQKGSQERALRMVNIGNIPVGEGEPCFIIAEAGINHNGDINLAKKLIDAAKSAEANAVKFQTFKTEDVVTRSAEKAAYQRKCLDDEESQFEMIKKLQLNEKDFGELFAYARKQEIIFLSSPFDKRSVDLLDELSIPAFKIPSGEITNFPLLKHIARKKKPIILSTGMATLGEIEDAVGVIYKEGVNDVILLHCVSDYPAKIEDMNLRAMESLRSAFNLPVGLSDHSQGITIPIAAAALGACIIEKHFTLDKNLSGPDHKVSLEPNELIRMVKAVRETENALGNGMKNITKNEEKIKKIVRRSIVASVDISKGAIITEEMLTTKRPGTGIEPKYIGKIVGRKAKRNIKEDCLISWDII